MSDSPSVAARDDLAGVVDLFGALTRAELIRALEELAFKAGTEVDTDALATAVDEAVADYYLVAAEPKAVEGVDPADLEELGADDAADGDDAGDGDGADDAAAAREPASGDGPQLLAVGPAAFPALPANAEDLPHILEVGERAVDREALAATVRERLERDAVAAIDGGDDERMEALLDVCFDLEAWAPVDASGIRGRLTAELDG